MHDAQAAVDRRIGVTVLTGFLGSGKTTLLNRLLTLPRYRRALVVVNEFGEVGVDHTLVRAVSDQVVLLAGGCICCTVRGGLVQTLRDMFMLAVQRKIAPFDHVWIETTGLADAAPVLFTLRHDFFIAQRYGTPANCARGYCRAEQNRPGRSGWSFSGLRGCRFGQSFGLDARTQCGRVITGGVLTNRHFFRGPGHAG